jgi:hypothetical protein
MADQKQRRLPIVPGHARYMLLGNWQVKKIGDQYAWCPPANCRGGIDLAGRDTILSSDVTKPRPVGLFECSKVPDDWDGEVLSTIQRLRRNNGSR